MCCAVTRLLKHCWSTQPTTPGPDVLHPSSTLKRWGSRALHRASPRLKSSSPKLPISWWEISLQLLGAVGSHGQPDPCPPTEAGLFGHTPHPLSLVDWCLTILTLPPFLTWSIELSCGDLSWEGRWTEGTIPFSTVSYCRPHNISQQRLGKSWVKPVEVLEKTNHWHYLQLLTAPETHPAVLSAWTTNFLKAAFQIVVWLVLRHLRHCSP